MRRRRKRSARSKRVWMTSVGIGAVLGAGVALYLHSGDAARAWLSAELREPRYWLETVEFLGLAKLSPQSLIEHAGLSTAVPLIDLDPDVLATKLASHPRVVSCIAARIPPDRLVIEIDERVPVAQLAGKAQGIDLEGTLFPLVDNEGAELPTVHGKVEWALPLLRAAKERGVKLAVVQARAANDLRFRPVGHQVQVRVASDPDTSLRGWLQIRESGLLRSYAAREVDLRFRGNALLRDFGTTKQGGEDGSS